MIGDADFRSSPQKQKAEAGRRIREEKPNFEIV